MALWCSMACDDLGKRARGRGRVVGWSVIGALALACGRPPFLEAGETSGGFTETATGSSEGEGPSTSTTAEGSEVGTVTSSASEGPESGEVSSVSSAEEADWGEESPEGPEWSAVETGSVDWSESAEVTTESGSSESGTSGDCCEIHGGTGCEDPAVADCVCASDPYCCETFWDSLCVEEVDSLGCGFCGGSTVTSASGVTTGPDTGWDSGEVTTTADSGGWDDPIPPGDCCEPNEVPWCQDDEVALCVCEAAPFCCEEIWDEECVFLVDALGCGSCGGWGEEGSTDDGLLPDGEPCFDNGQCSGGLCWGDQFSTELTCRSSCIDPGAPLNFVCDDDLDCCEGSCQLIEPFGVGSCL